MLEPSELEGVAILDGVAIESVWGILSHCPVLELPVDHTLISPENVERTLYLLLSGRLAVYLDRPVRRGSEPTGFASRSVADLVPGQAVGEISVLEARPATAYVLTATPARVLAIGESIFWRLIQASHEFSINLLLLLARRMRENNRQLSESVAQQRVLEREVTTDALTGLFNRRWLDQRLPRFVERHRRSGSPFSLMMIDVDHFKSVNDRYGHNAGDEVLVFVARTLLASLRPSDMSARYGGEEVAVILPDTDLEGACIAAERLRRAIEVAVPPHDPSQRVTVSVGVSSLGEGEGAHALLSRADALLYRAKARGRNRVES